MIYLSEIRDWLKTFDIAAENYCIGRMDGRKDKSIGVYQRSNSPLRECIGMPSSYQVKPISVKIHWNKNANETEQAAYQLYQRLKAVSSFDINKKHIIMLKLLHSEPIDILTDEFGVYERVIEFDLYYTSERTDE